MVDHDLRNHPYSNSLFWILCLLLHSNLRFYDKCLKPRNLVWKLLSAIWLHLACFRSIPRLPLLHHFGLTLDEIQLQNPLVAYSNSSHRLHFPHHNGNCLFYNSFEFELNWVLNVCGYLLYWTSYVFLYDTDVRLINEKEQLWFLQA